MKNQALARVFAIVLAVMCVVMLAAGAGGVRSAFNDKKSDDEALELMNKRIVSAEELQGILAQSESYEEQSEALEELKGEHDTDSSQHRTDLATYSATRGGTKMGADKLWDAKAQAANGRQQLEAAMTQLEQGEAAYALYTTAGGLASNCSAYAGEAGAAFGVLSAAGRSIAAIMTNPTEDPAADEAEIARLTGEALANAATYIAHSDSYTSTKNSAVGLLTQVMALSGGSFDASMMPADISVSLPMVDLTTATQQTAAAQQTLAGLSSALTTFMTGSGMDSTTGDTLAATRTQLEAALAQLESGEKEIQTNLELIWYQNGELEKDAAELQEQKGELESEGEMIARLETAAEERKENERQYNSLSVLLKKNANVAAAVNGGDDLIESARLEATRLAAETEYSFIMRLVICGISILGALAGLLGIPAAFEKTKSRTMLLLPVLLCLVCAAEAVGLSFYAGRGALYSAIFTLPFALIQLLVILPKKAKPRAAE